MRSLALSAAVLGLAALATALPARLPRSELGIAIREDTLAGSAGGFGRRGGEEEVDDNDVVVADGFRRREDEDVVVADGFKKREDDDVVVADGF